MTKKASILNESQFNNTKFNTSNRPSNCLGDVLGSRSKNNSIKIETKIQNVFILVFVYLPFFILSISCDAKKNKDYVKLLNQNASLETELILTKSKLVELQDELSKWKADDKANYKILRESYENASTVASCNSILKSIQSFQELFPKSTMYNDATQLVKLVQSKRNDFELREKERQSAISENMQLANAPLVSGYDYKNNPANFNSQHLNQLVRATGKIEYLTPRSFIFYSYPGPSITCIFDTPLTTVHTNQEVQIAGIYKGLGDHNLEIIHCKLLP